MSKQLTLTVLLALSSMGYGAEQVEENTTVTRSSYPSLLRIEMPPINSIKSEVAKVIQKMEKHGQTKTENLLPELKEIPFESDGISGKIIINNSTKSDLEKFTSADIEERDIYYYKDFIMIFYREKSGSNTNVVAVELNLVPILLDYENCTLTIHNEGRAALWSRRNHLTGSLPSLMCTIKASSQFKQTLKDRATEAVANHWKQRAVSRKLDGLSSDAVDQVGNELESQFTYRKRQDG